MKPINIKDKNFWKCVKNTRDDFIKMTSDRFVNSLSILLRDRYLTITNIQDLVLVINTRKENMNQIKLWQDLKTFNLINKEHKIMETVLSKYFVIKDVGCDLLSVSLKGEVVV